MRRFHIRSIISSVIIMFSVCAGKTLAESPIVGKWFDNNGKVYRFLSDSTMGDEGEYPNGSYTFDQQKLTITENGNTVVDCNSSLDGDVLVLLNGQNENTNTLFLWKAEFQLDNSRNKPGPNDPIGCIDIVATGEGAFYVAGWAFDPDEPEQTVYVDVYANRVPGAHKFIGSYPADTLRQDVDDIYHCGSRHGISFTCTNISSYIGAYGKSSLYVCARNLGAGNDVELGQGNIWFSSDIQDLQDLPAWKREEIRNGALTSSDVDSGNLTYTSEQASLAIMRYGIEQYSDQGGNFHFSDEYLEDPSTYVVWYRWPTGFTGKYSADLYTGDVYVTGPYWGIGGRDGMENMPLTTAYAFNVGDYLTSGSSGQYQSGRLELSEFVGQNYQLLLNETDRISVLRKSSDEIKLGNDHVSITALPDGRITRIRLDEGENDFRVEGVSADMGTTDIQAALFKAGYVEKNMELPGEDDGWEWRIFFNDQKNRFLAFNPYFTSVTQIYYGLLGYLPF